MKSSVAISKSKVTGSWVSGGSAAKYNITLNSNGGGDVWIGRVSRSKEDIFRVHEALCFSFRFTNVNFESILNQITSDQAYVLRPCNCGFWKNTLSNEEGDVDDRCQQWGVDSNVCNIGCSI